MLTNILSIVVAVLGVVLALVSPAVGIAFAVLGVALFVWNKKTIAKKKEAQRPRERKTYDIAGIKYHENELLEMSTESEEYGMSKAKIIDEGKEDEHIYKYDFPSSAKLEKDPENEHDKNAVKVIVGGRLVGFIPAKDAVEVGEILETKEVESINAFIEGGPYKVYDSNSEEIEKGEEPFSGIVTVVFLS